MRQNVTSIRTSHDRRLRHPLSGWLYMGNWHGEQHAGARADPKQLVASQQCGDPETRGLVLPNYVIATCSKFNASVKINAGPLVRRRDPSYCLSINQSQTDVAVSDKFEVMINSKSCTFITILSFR